MSKVRVLGRHAQRRIYTYGGRQTADWEVSGPHFAGWELYHLKGSPADPQSTCTPSQSQQWFGQIIQRSDDGGKTGTNRARRPVRNPRLGRPGP